MVHTDPQRAPSLIKLAWHSSLTYKNYQYQGGGDELQFRRALGGNAGLALTAMPWLEGIKEEAGAEISLPDLYTLGGVAAIEALGGPKIRWRAGRKDGGEERGEGDTYNDSCIISNDANQLRCIFESMDFQHEDRDKAIVALSGAHALGRLTGGTAINTNYFKFLALMKKKRGAKREWDGPFEVENDIGKMMLMPTDLALIEDPRFFKWVSAYAKDDGSRFFSDFSIFFQQLTEMGCTDLFEVAAV